MSHSNANAKPQTGYVCLYTCEGEEYSVLVAVKNFSYSRIEHGKKVIDGKYGSGPFGIFNNPGQHVFPGGKSNPGESILKAALREFEQETGIHFAVSFEMSELDGKDIKYLTTKIGDMNIKCQHYIKKFDNYFGIYVNVPTKYDLDMLANKMKKNIEKNLTASDELNKVVTLKVGVYQDRKMHSKYTKFLEQYHDLLSTPKDHSQWKLAFDDIENMDFLPSFPAKCTKSLETEKIGLEVFAKENYCIKPFLLKLKNRDFKLLTGTYAFMKKSHTKNSTPTRFSTDWFGSIAEHIVSVHALMGTSTGEPDTGYQAHSSVAAAREHVFHKAATVADSVETESAVVKEDKGTAEGEVVVQETTEGEAESHEKA